MHISELAACKNTAKLNSALNPVIWDRREHLKPAVRDQILAATEEYCVYLGLTESQINDIVVDGDMASFKYSNQSAIDVVVVADLDPDPTFREFFNENKYKYNGQQQVKVHGHLVQFYVQPADQQFITNGSYSVLRESWVQIPKRTITEDTVSTLRALDQAARPRPQVKKKKKVVKEAIIVQYGFGSDFLDEVGVTPDGVSASTCMFANEEDLNEVGITPDGTNASTCEFANEDGAPSSKEQIVQDFVEFCADQLGLEREPDLRIKRDPEWSKRAKTFGRYNPGTNQLEVSLSNRHVMDILRTVAHELTHQHQHERESVPSHAGETGSEWENEANARAGILMRDYGQTNPHLFDAADDLDEGWKNWAAAGLATAALAGGAQPAHAQSVQQGLGAVQNIGTAVNTFRGVDWNAMLRSEAGTALYNFILANGGNPNSQNQSSLYQWQKQMQQSQSAQPGQSAQAQQYTQQAAPASATTSMYNNILQQQQGRANTNESSGYITPNKLFCRKVNSKEELIEYAKKLSCALDTDRPITHLNRYTVVCSTLFAMARANLVESNVPEFINSVKDFINVLNKFDEFKKLNIKVGSKVAIISYQALGDSVEVWGFINPKTITKIKRDPNDQSIKQFEFNNDPSDVWPRSDNAEYNGNFLTNSAFFGSKESAEKALSWALTTKKDNISISNHIKENINESSGYIPTAAQADDPRFEMALTADVRPGATGKNANKLQLNTDAQGHPQLLRADGMVQRMMAEYLEFKK